jgi:hypothetical protein
MPEQPIPGEPPPAPKPQPERSWWQKTLDFLWQHATGFVTMTLLGILAAFSGCIVEGVKFRLNRADLRSDRYQSLATELSNFVFSVELVQEFFEANWTTLPTLKWLIPEYNTSITNLRKNEYVYLQWLHHYWGEERAEQFAEIIKVVKKIDRTIHSLNDELEKVENDNKNHPKVNEERAQKAATELKSSLKSLQEKTRDFLNDLK